MSVMPRKEAALQITQTEECWEQTDPQGQDPATSVYWDELY